MHDYQGLLKWNLNAANKIDQEIASNRFSNTRSIFYFLEI